jgi:hypothetical protein
VDHAFTVFFALNGLELVFFTSMTLKVRYIGGVSIDVSIKVGEPSFDDNDQTRFQCGVYGSIKN